MIEKLIAWSARNRFLVIVVTAAALYLGINAIKNVPLDAIPDL